jgi:hypothetical protein
MSAENSIDAYVEQWLLREPGMRLALGFLPQAQREQWSAWGALLFQLRESLFELSDLSVRQAKTAWWADECWGKSRQLARHPLMKVLPDQLPWVPIASALSQTLDSLEQSSSLLTQQQALLPLAASIADAESSWSKQNRDESVSHSLIRHWMLHRLSIGLLRDDRAGIELRLIAKHSQVDLQSQQALRSSLVQEWADTLQKSSSNILQASRFRRQRHALDAIILQRLVAGQGFSEPSGLGTLIALWNAARKAPL